MWDERYAAEGYAYGTEPNDFLRAEAARIRSGGRVLCLAEGEGRNAVFLAGLGYRVTAMDLSPVGLGKARALAAKAGVEIATVAADLAEFDLGRARWDGVVAIWAHLPPELRRDVHARIVDALAPGGVVLLEAYTERQLEMPGRGGPPAAMREHLMSLAALREEFAGLEIEVGRELDRDVQEGEYHRGESAVVQVVARKTV